MSAGKTAAGIVLTLCSIAAAIWFFFPSLLNFNTVVNVVKNVTNSNPLMGTSFQSNPISKSPINTVQVVPTEKTQPKLVEPTPVAPVETITTGGIGRNIDASKLAERIHQLINQERVRNQLGVLSLDSNLSIIAVNHSHDMAAKDYFDHVNLIGQDSTARAKSAEYQCFKDYGSYYTDGIAENIFQDWTYSSTDYINGIAIHNWNSLEEVAQDAVNGWMGSQGHRENILTATFDKEGLGVAIASDDKIYVTQDFC